MLLIFSGHRRTLDEGAEVGETRDRILGAEDGKLAKGIRTARRPELTWIDALLQVDAPLDVMPAAGVAAVVTRVHASVAIEFKAERITRTLAEDIVFTRLRIVAPDHAPLEMNRGGITGIKTRTGHARGRGAPMHAVNPAVGAKDNAVADGVCVFEPEPCEMDDRRAVWFIRAISIRIEQQIRRVHHPHAAEST